MTTMMRQEAPYPVLLQEIVQDFHYRPGWLIWLRDYVRDQDHGRGQGSGLTLFIQTNTCNAYHHEQTDYNVDHLFIVPAATYDRRSWMAWLLNRCFDVERHEACEFFEVAGERPFAPHHGPGEDPYTVFIHGSDEERRTSFRGAVNAP